MSHGAQDLPLAIFLDGERLGMRAPVPDDSRHARAWLEGPYAISCDAAEKMVRQQETVPWGNNPTIRLVAVDPDGGAIIGGALVERSDHRVAKLRVTSAEASHPELERQRIRADMLRTLLPWLMDELDLMVVTVDIPADETIVVQAAEVAGMTQAVRLREFVHRPTGRVDLLMFERVNRSWGTHIVEGRYADA